MKRSDLLWMKWQRLVQEQERSGLSVHRFCNAHDIAASTMFAWRRRLREAGILGEFEGRRGSSASRGARTSSAASAPSPWKPMSASSPMAMPTPVTMRMPAPAGTLTPPAMPRPREFVEVLRRDGHDVGEAHGLNFGAPPGSGNAQARAHAHPYPHPPPHPHPDVCRTTMHPTHHVALDPVPAPVPDPVPDPDADHKQRSRTIAIELRCGRRMVIVGPGFDRTLLREVIETLERLDRFDLSPNDITDHQS